MKSFLMKIKVMTWLWLPEKPIRKIPHLQFQDKNFTSLIGQIDEPTVISIILLF